MINRSVLVGRLTKDVELAKTPNGASVVKFNLAVNRNVKAQGQPEADFINCVAWNRVADLMAQYLHKGSLIGVEGRIQTSSYTNQMNEKRYSTDVIVESLSFLEPKGNSQPQQNTYNAPQNNGYSQGYSQNQYNQQNTYNNAPYNQYNNAPQNQQYNNYGYEPQNQYNDFGGDTLDIASDDLPF